MDFTRFLSDKGNPPSVADELIYEFIAAELAHGNVRQGLWAKALSDVDWDENKAKATYVRMRLAQLREEVDRLIQEAARQIDPHAQALRAAIEDATSSGLSQEEIEYLGKPIRALHYLAKYKVTQKEVQKACAMKRLTSVMNQGVLWVSDRRL